MIKFRLYLFLISFYVNLTNSAEEMRPLINIGTVLFTHADTRRECFSADEVALLTSRMMFQDLLPSETELSVHCNENIMDLIEYFRIMLEVVRCITHGRSKHIILMALTDTLGGYMRHLVLPLAKFSYYAGQIKYSTVIKLYQLYDELKLYLRTDGQGWKAPRDNLGVKMEAEEISLEGPSPKTDPCKGLIYSKGPSRKMRALDQAVPGGTGTETPGCDVQVPMPFFDSRTQPSAIAVPFKSFTLRNLQSRSSAYILVKLYMAVLRCMTQKNSGERSVQRFNNDYFNFLAAKVMPRLKDEKFYAAFGGVLRVMASLRKSGFLGSSKEIGNYNVMPVEDIQDKEEINEDEFEVVANTEKPRKSNMILIAALITIAVWFILGALFICYKMRSTKGSSKVSRETDSGSSPSKKTIATKKISSVCLPCIGKGSKSSDVNKKSSKGSDSASYCTKENCPRLRDVSSSSVTQKNSSKKNVKISDSRDSSSCKTSSYTGSGSYAYDDDDYTDSTQNMSSKQAFYPTYYACHSSLTGNYKSDKYSKTVSSTEDEDDVKKQFVFGYDFHTTSTDSSPGDGLEDDNDLGGNMSR